MNVFSLFAEIINKDFLKSCWILGKVVHKNSEIRDNLQKKHLVQFILEMHNLTRGGECIK